MWVATPAEIHVVEIDLKDKLNDICGYLDDIFTIDKPEFAKMKQILTTKKLLSRI